MRKPLLLPSLFATAVLACSAGKAPGQTYYYIDGITVSPPAPTASDTISITLHGNLSSSGAYIVSASQMLMGNTVHITVIAADPGGLAVLVPHDETLDIAPLAAGTYNILIDGVAVLDMAPEFQHQFVVSGGGSPCDDLEIVSIQWQAFSDTAIVVHVHNNSVELFDYPNFILFDANGDTLAKELVNFFGIGQDSWHVLRLMDGATIPNGSFDMTLELWVLFTTELACSSSGSIDLCPPPPCATLVPNIQNFGNGLAIGSYPWSILNENIEVVASGVFTMTDIMQMDADTICLPPGHYTMTCQPNDPPTGGQPVFGVQTPGWISGPSQAISWDLNVPLPFDFYAPCIEGTNDIAEMPSQQPLTVIPRDGGFSVSSADGRALGAITVFDAQGRSLYQGSTSSSTTLLKLPTVRSGVVIIRAGDLMSRMVLLTQ